MVDLCSDFGRKKENGKGGLRYDDGPVKDDLKFHRACVDDSCFRIREQLYCLGGIEPAVDIRNN